MLTCRRRCVTYTTPRAPTTPRWSPRRSVVNSGRPWSAPIASGGFVGDMSFARGETSRNVPGHFRTNTCKSRLYCGTPRCSQRSRETPRARFEHPWCVQSVPGRCERCEAQLASLQAKSIPGPRCQTASDGAAVKGAAAAVREAQAAGPTLTAATPTRPSLRVREGSLRRRG